MALTLAEAQKMSRNPLASGLIKEIVTDAGMFSLLPFESKSGESFGYTREGELPSAGFVDPNHTALPESSGKGYRVTVPIRLLISDVKVPKFADDMMNDAIDQTATQLGMKMKAAGRTLSQALISGRHTSGHTLYSSADPFVALGNFRYGPHMDSARHGNGQIDYEHAGTRWRFKAPGDFDFGPWVTVAATTSDVTLYSANKGKYITVDITVGATPTQDGRTDVSFSTSNDEPDGVNSMLAPGQIVESTGANGDAFGFGKLDKLISRVKVKRNRAFLMNSSLVEKLYEAHRALGGTDPRTVMLPGYGSEVPTYRGIPIIEDDFIASTEAKGGSSTLSSVYLAAFDADEGLFAGASGSAQAIVDGDPRSRSVLGFRVEHVGTSQTSDHDIWRVKWYGAFGMKSSLSVARATEIE
ncbi:MAG: hypothetical protein RLP09_03140, partial [Sandaracinaceae bacterium]